IRTLLASQQLRYLIVGGLNTLLGFVLFAGLEAAFGEHVGYLAVLAIATVVCIAVAYCAHRWFTFQVSGQWLLDLARFSSVYGVVFVFNVAALPVLVELLHLSPTSRQGIFTV